MDIRVVKIVHCIELIRIKNYIAFDLFASIYIKAPRQYKDNIFFASKSV